MKIETAQNPQEISRCWDAMFALRPHLKQQKFVNLVQAMQLQGYMLSYVQVQDKVVAVVGYRYVQNFYSGKHIYIDDLSTISEYRGKGYGTALLKFVEEYAKARGLHVIKLDSGHQRFDAHRLYLNEGYQITSHHFTKEW